MHFRALGYLVLFFAAITGAYAVNDPVPLPPTTEEVTLLYRANQGQNLWVRFGRPTPFARAALSVLSEAHSHGLDENDYQVDLLHVLHESLIQGAQEHAQAFELGLSKSLLQFVADMRPNDFGSLGKQARAEGLVMLVLDAVYADELEHLADRLTPRDPQYAALQAALGEYDARARYGRQVQIGSGPILKRGDFGPRVALLRMRLLGLADRAYGEYERSLFDEELESAVIAYQVLHGLDADGVVGPATVQHLDRTDDERRAIIRLNLERWRRLPLDLGREHVLVNIPEYRLRLVQGREERLSMRVVVGAKTNQTPEFSDEIEYLVFNPYWYVPRSIVREELIPAQSQSSDYLSRHGYELLDGDRVIDPASVDWTPEMLQRFPYKVRQKPGPGNALGGLKFVLPNSLDIYLHDSPQRHLYARSRRGFSHGCIRLEYPELLAQALLKERPEWSESSISSAIARGVRRQVNLSAPVPIYLTYLTVRVEDDGSVAFLDDVYGRDAARLARYL